MSVSLQSLYISSPAAPLDTSQLELIDCSVIESHNSPHVRVTCLLNTKTLPHPSPSAFLFTEDHSLSVRSPSSLNLLSFSPSAHFLSLFSTSPLLHKSDLRDSHEYFEKQKWGTRICNSLSRNRFDLVRTRLTEAFIIVGYDSARSTYIFRNNLCTLGCRSNLSCVR